MITLLALKPQIPTPVSAYDLDYLVIAGGGGGSQTNSLNIKCGGAGGYISGQLASVTYSVYTMYVGAGGATGSLALNGSNSLLQSSVSISALGGGSNAFKLSPLIPSGGVGGSGAGSPSPNEFAGTIGQGNNGRGARPNRGFLWGLGGSGGAGQAGDWAEFTAKGGDGLTWLDGITRGGGAGGWRNLLATEGALSGQAGAGGGGVSANTEVSPVVVAQAGSANTGGGGGGCFVNSSNQATGAAQPGGSGIIKVRYAGTPRATGGTITQDGGYTYHEFTSSGRLIFTS